MTLRRLLVAGALLLTLAGLAAALPGYSLNPAGTDAIVNGQLVIQGDGTRAPLNVTVFTSMPPAPADNSIWIVHGGGQQAFCFRAAGTTFCSPTVITP